MKNLNLLNNINTIIELARNNNNGLEQLEAVNKINNDEISLEVQGYTYLSLIETETSYCVFVYDVKTYFMKLSKDLSKVEFNSQGNGKIKDVTAKTFNMHFNNMVQLFKDSGGKNLFYVENELPEELTTETTKTVETTETTETAETTETVETTETTETLEAYDSNDYIEFNAVEYKTLEKSDYSKDLFKHFTDILGGSEIKEIFNII